MKELKHDIESYIITIKRKGGETSGPQTVTSAKPHLAPLVHEASEPSACEGTVEITAPLPGIIVDLKVKAGDTVRQGQELAVLEAMKMENSIESPNSGTVQTVNVAVGDTVSEGTVILTVSL